MYLLLFRKTSFGRCKVRKLKLNLASIGTVQAWYGVIGSYCLSFLAFQPRSVTTTNLIRNSRSESTLASRAYLDRSEVPWAENKQTMEHVFVCCLITFIVILFTVSSFFSFILLFVILSSLLVNSSSRVFLFFLCVHCGR